MRNVLIVGGIVALLTALGIGGWWMFANSVPRNAPDFKGVVESVQLSPKGGHDVLVPNYSRGQPLHLYIPPKTPIRRRDGGTTELKAGQTISIWFGTFGNLSSVPGKPHSFADAKFVAIESDG